MDVNLSILYQSNIHEQTQKWNQHQDGATGILGLGWKLPLERITLDPSSGLNAGARKYSYEGSGGSTPLVRDIAPNPTLFKITGKSSLSTGGVSNGVRTAFEDHGFDLDPASTVAPVAGANDRWTITDPVNERVFEASANGSALDVSDAGDSYQLLNYKFWRIHYFPSFERWEVVKDSGIRQSFGGGLETTAAGARFSAGNSIEWAVAWADSSGTICWTGASELNNTSSNQVGAQKQYARAWHLRSMSDVWGDQVVYGYNEFDASGSFSAFSKSASQGRSAPLPVVEQLVGASGLPYTRACYLTSVTDVFQRRLVLRYGNKSYTAYDPGTASTAAAAREYLDPHRELSAQVVLGKTDSYPAPNAYQDRYETLYLSAIDVRSPGGGLLSECVLDYQLASSYAGYDTSDRLTGDTVKRQLTGLSNQNAAGESLLPGASELAFAYSGAGDPSPGALDKITFPDGGVATYTYAKSSLKACDRQQVVKPPQPVKTPPPPKGTYAAFQDSPEPNVFFGHNYAVSLWEAADKHTLSLHVYTWEGRWIAWDLNDKTHGSKIYGGGTEDISDLDVQTAEDFFVVTFNDGNGNLQGYVFHADPAVPGRWTPFASDASGQTGYNNPSFELGASSKPKIHMGDSWFVTQADQSLKRYTYRWATLSEDKWATDQWAVETLNTDDDTDYYLAASGRCYCLISSVGSKAKAQVCWIDAQQGWHAGDSQDVPALDLSGQSTSSVNMVCGTNVAVLTYVTRQASHTINYSLGAVQWNADYQILTDVTWDGGTDTLNGVAQVLEDQFPHSPPSIVPQIVSESQFGCASHGFRFDGETWRSAQISSSGGTIDHQQYFHGQDYVVMSYQVNGKRTIQAAILPFDPATHTWQTDAATMSGLSTNVDTGKPSLQSSGRGDVMLVVGDTLYVRPAGSTWKDAVASAAKTWGSDALDSSVNIDQAPTVISYLDKAGGVTNLVLRNGQYDATLSTGQVLKNQDYANEDEQTFAADSKYGRAASGQGTLATYSGSSFPSASQFNLYRFTGYAITGPIEAYSVVASSLDGGMGQSFDTAYAYDPLKAACDPTGKIVKYYQATSYPGCTDPGKPANGYRVLYYNNGLLPVGLATGELYYQALDGLLGQSETYDQAGNALETHKRTWTPFTSRAGSFTDASVANVPIKGVYVLETGHCSQVDGVTSTGTQTYWPDQGGWSAPVNGKVIGKQGSHYDGAGDEISTSESYVYGCQEQPLFGAVHQLTAMVQRSTTADSTTTSAEAQLYGQLATPSGRVMPVKIATFRWIGSGSFSDFPFPSTADAKTLAASSWQAAWLRVSQDIGYTSQGGLPAATLNAGGVVHSTLFDKNEQFEIASVTNGLFTGQTSGQPSSASAARGGDAVYSGFESYEDISAWALGGGAKTWDKDARSGAQCLQLPASGGSAAASASSLEGGVGYTVGFWYKTAAGFEHGKLSVAVSGAASASHTYSSTNGDWVWVSFDLDGPRSAGRLTVTWTNRSSTSEAWLDNVEIRPTVSDLSAHIYQPTYAYLVGQVHPGGRVAEIFRDGLHRIVAGTGADRNLKTLKMKYDSRMHNAEFSSADPNTSVQLRPATSGSIEAFRGSGDYAARWTVSGGTWSESGGLLTQSAGGSITIKDPASTADAIAMYLDISTVGGAAISNPVKIVAEVDSNDGNGFAPLQTFVFTPSTRKWTGGSGGTGAISGPGASQSNVPRSLCLYKSPDVVLLFADGHCVQSVFLSASEKQKEAAAGATHRVRFETGQNKMAVANLAHLVKPEVTVGFEDGANHSLQSQQLIEADAYVTQTTYDALGRHSLSSKPCPFTYPSRPATPLGAYRANVLSDDGSTGDCVDFYQSSTGAWAGPPAFTPTDDDGHPFVRKSYALSADTTSPRSTLASTSPPGTAASYDQGTEKTIDLYSDGATRHYQTNKDAGGDPIVSSLPAPFSDHLSSYHFEAKVDVETVVRLRDLRGHTVFSARVEGGTIERQKVHLESYNATGRTVTERQPNYYSKRTELDTSKFVVVVQEDKLGRVVSRQTPDQGTTQFIYDNDGKLRFIYPHQPPSGGQPPSDSYVIYNRYDELERLISTGKLAVTSAELSSDYTAIKSTSPIVAHLQDPSWPPAGTHGLSEAKSIAYNSAGEAETVTVSNPRQINGKDATFVVTEQLSYGADGAVQSHSQAIQGPSQQIGSTYATTYERDNLGRITSTQLPSGVGGALTGSFDQLGRSVQTSYAGGAHAPSIRLADTHNAAGQIVERDASWHQGGKAFTDVYASQCAYDSPGWPYTGDVPGINAGTTYRRADGKIVQQALTAGLDESGNGSVSTAANYDLGIGYDASGRVTSTSGSSTGTLGYDENGNLLSVTGKDPATYGYTKSPAAGSVPNDWQQYYSAASATSIAYDPQGRISKAPANGSSASTNQLAYDDAMDRPASIKTTSGGQSTFVYGSQGQRVYEQRDTIAHGDDTVVGLRVYISPGAHEVAVVDLKTPAHSRVNVYGPSGELAALVIGGSGCYFSASTPNHTVTLWVDTDKKVAVAYAFDVFGIATPTVYDHSVQLPTVFMGQPLDSDTGVYNFRARLYDPHLRRFLGPDPAHQYANPYVFNGNDPVNRLDPSGEFSWSAFWAGVVGGLEVAVGTLTWNPILTAAGVVGVVDVARHSHEGKKIWGNMLQAEAGAAISAAEVSAGAAVSALSLGAASGTAGAALIGAGISGMDYSLVSGTAHFDWSKFGESEALGAIGGAITGGVGAVTEVMVAKVASKVALEATMSFGGGAASSLATTGISDKIHHKKWKWSSAITAAAVSGALGAVGTGIKATTKLSIGHGSEDPDEVFKGTKVKSEQEHFWNLPKRIAYEVRARMELPSPRRLIKPFVYNSQKAISQTESNAHGGDSGWWSYI